MNPKTYKNQWSAVENGTYWAAAKFLERVKYEKAESKKKEKQAQMEAKKAAKSASAGTRRLASENVGEQEWTKKFKATTPAPKTKTEMKLEALTLIAKIQAVDLVDDRICDSYTQVVKKIKEFLKLTAYPRLCC